MFAGVQPGKQRSPCTADMQIARRAGSKACFGTHEVNDLI